MHNNNNIFSSPKSGSLNIRYFIAVVLLIIVFALLLVTAGLLPKTQNQPHLSTFNSTDHLFNPNKVNDIHIQFTDSAWNAMQPHGGPFGVNGIGVGWRDFGGILANMYLYLGDTNSDNFLSEKEYFTLFHNWFKAWDTAGNQSLDAAMISLGYAKSTSETLIIKGPTGNGVARAHGVVTPEVIADLQFNAIDFPSIAIRYKGNGTLLDSRTILKKSIKIDLNDGFRGRNISESTKLNLHSLITDLSYMNDVLAYQIFRENGVPGPRTAYARIYVTVPDSLENEYLGLYLIVENIDNNFALDKYGTKKGVLFKPVTHKFFKYVGDNWADYIDAFDPKTPLSIQEEQRMIDICKFVSLSNEKEFNENLNKYFDLDNLARYFAINALISDLDGILGIAVQNIYMYLHPKTMRLSFIPWDHDHSLGNFWQGRKQEDFEQQSIQKPWMNNKFFISRLFHQPEFHSLYMKYLREFHEKVVCPDSIIHKINALAPIIRPSVELESADKLRMFDFFVGWNGIANSPEDSANTMYKKPLRAFIKSRYASVEDQLNGTSEGIRIDNENAFNMGGIFVGRMDKDGDGKVSKDEFDHQIEEWFEKWAKEDTTKISKQEFINGLNSDFLPFGPDPKLIAKKEQEE